MTLYALVQGNVLMRYDGPVPDPKKYFEANAFGGKAYVHRRFFEVHFWQGPDDLYELPIPGGDDDEL